jgi:hypothetical protein
MRRLMLLSMLLIACGHTAIAAPAGVWWPEWGVISSEELSSGIKYTRDAEIPRYPLSRMFDHNAGTAWVFSATTRQWDSDEWQSPYGLTLTPEHPVTIDGLRIMNGQNVSEQRFHDNDIVTKIRVTLVTAHGSVVRTATLPDKMGWHTVALPKSTAKAIKIEVTGILGGGGEHPDLCISELALMRGGKEIDMHMPKAVMYYNGLEGCGASYLIATDGKDLEGIATDDGNTDSWSPSGNYVSGIAGPDNRFWVANVWTKQVYHDARQLHLAGADGKWLTKVAKEAKVLKNSGE